MDYNYFFILIYFNLILIDVHDAYKLCNYTYT